jgi:cbb3-type cytochrome oxidase subunit 1
MSEWLRVLLAIENPVQCTRWAVTCAHWCQECAIPFPVCSVWVRGRKEWGGVERGIVVRDLRSSGWMFHEFYVVVNRDTPNLAVRVIGYW